MSTNQISFDHLDDDVLLEIFKNKLNLNDRTVLRLVNKRIKKLVDSIQITNLIIFDRRELKNGEYKMLNEKYDLKDCVHVVYLDKFFDDSVILNQLKNSIKRLIIYGRNSLVRLESCLPRLEYLELYSIKFSNSKILETETLKWLLLESGDLEKNLSFDPNVPISLRRSDLAKAFEMIVFGYGIENCKSKLHHLVLKQRIDDQIHNYLWYDEISLCKSLYQMDLLIDDFKTLVIVSKRYPNLKKLNVTFNNVERSDTQCLPKATLQTDFKRLASKIRSDLEVRIFGILFNKSTAEFVYYFLLCVGVSLFYRLGKISLYLDEKKSVQKNLKALAESEESQLDSFYKTIETILPYNVFDEEIFSKMINVKFMNFIITKNDSTNLIKCLDFFKTNLLRLTLTTQGFTVYDNTILDVIPLHYSSSEFITISCWKPSQINFNFLLRFNYLGGLKLFIHSSIDESMVIELISKYKFYDLDIYFLKPEEQTMEKLSSIKKKINDAIKDLEMRCVMFKIQIYHYKNNQGDKGQIIRYFLERTFSKSKFNPNLNKVDIEANDDLPRMRRFFDHLKNSEIDRVLNILGVKSLDELNVVRR